MIADDNDDCYFGSPTWPQCLYEVDDPPIGGGDGGGTNSCGCNNNADKLKPSGKVSVEDTQFGLQGVKNIWMRAQNDVFGFSWSHTQCDANGCFKFDKAFTAKDISIRLLYNNERIWMRSWRGARVWNMILPMTSRKRTVNKQLMTNVLFLMMITQMANRQQQKKNGQDVQYLMP